MYVNILG